MEAERAEWMIVDGYADGGIFSPELGDLKRLSPMQALTLKRYGPFVCLYPRRRMKPPNTTSLSRHYDLSSGSIYRLLTSD